MNESSKYTFVVIKNDRNDVCDTMCTEWARIARIWRAWGSADLFTSPPSLSQLSALPGAPSMQTDFLQTSTFKLEHGRLVTQALRMRAHFKCSNAPQRRNNSLASELQRPSTHNSNNLIMTAGGGEEGPTSLDVVSIAVVITTAAGH